MAKVQPIEVEVEIEEATVLNINDTEYSGRVSVSQSVADELLKTGRASLVSTTQTQETTDGTTGSN